MAREESPPSVGSPGVGDASALLALLGTSENDGRVGRYVKSLAQSARPSKPERKSFPPSCEYFNHKSVGLSLAYESGVLDAIHLYADGVDGFTGFKGQAPWGVTLCDFEGNGEVLLSDRNRSTGKTVVEKLGEPTSKGKAGGFVFVQYDALGVKFDLESSDWENAEACVRCVSLWTVATGK
tara:strand:+ start:188 stop:730 length:543 start_codon:yes stop_codon:yes gene_type:complete